MAPVARELQIKLLTITNFKPPQENFAISTLESTFSDDYDLLNKEDEEILMFTEIFHVLGHQIPQSLLDNFQYITKTKRIPAKMDYSSKSATGSKDQKDMKTFFVYSEIKILAQICDSLSAKEVYK